MRKSNIKKLGLLLATVCGVQVICASTSKGDEAKAGIFSRGARVVGNFFRRAMGTTPNVSTQNSRYNFDGYRNTNFHRQGAHRREVRVFTSTPNQTNSTISIQDGRNGLFQIKKSANANGVVEQRIKVNPNGVYTEVHQNGKMVLKSNRVGNKTTTEWIGSNNLVTKREVRDPSKIKTTLFDNNGNKLSSQTHKR